MQYSLDEKVAIWLSAFEHLSEKKQYALLSLFDRPQDIFTQFDKKLQQIEAIIGNKVFSKMKLALSNEFLMSYIANLNQQEIRAVTIFSSDYPSQMKQAFQPPVCLFCKGDISLLKSFCIAIIGTRKPTAYGKNITEKFAKSLCKSGITILSGLAYGIDTIAHESTLANGGKTIAVLGGGFHHIYPQANAQLAKQIAKDGLLVSEFAPSVVPATFTFPKRNRTIALLSRGVLITEASLKSGSLHTKNFALDEGREVFAVVGNITSEESKGCNRMIKDGHATMVICPEDVAAAFQRELTPLELKQSEQVSLEEQVVLNMLRNAEVEFETLLLESGLDVKKLNSMLTSMQIKGIVKKLRGNVYTML